ncbi:MAG: hypothetical protein NTY53_18580 [Kiritimatiellaeota bacterium]|nr:hypothetical protein [Kiritimatiellota bacterium]
MLFTEKFKLREVELGILRRRLNITAPAEKLTNSVANIFAARLKAINDLRPRLGMPPLSDDESAADMKARHFAEYGDDAQPGPKNKMSYALRRARGEQ